MKNKEVKNYEKNEGFARFKKKLLPLLVPSLQPSLPLLALEYPSELSAPVLAQELAVVYQLIKHCKTRWRKLWRRLALNWCIQRQYFARIMP